MAHAYSDPTRATETYALPDVEIFYRTYDEWLSDGWNHYDDNSYTDGWYWWSCFPGCVPDSDPFGPFDTEAAAREHAQDIDQ